MFKNINLWKIIINLFGRKKIAEKNTIVVEKEIRLIEPKRLGGSRFTKSKYGRARSAREKRNRIQGRARDINHKKAA